jgi:hypothetical protein
MREYDFSGAQVTLVELSGWKARVANAVRRTVGNRLTLALCRLIPVPEGPQKGLLMWDPQFIYTQDDGSWAICWRTGAWNAFIVSKARSEAQRMAFRGEAIRLG